MSLVRLNPLSKNLFRVANGNRCHKQRGPHGLRHSVTGVTVAALAGAGSAATDSTFGSDMI